MTSRRHWPLLAVGLVSATVSLSVSVPLRESRHQPFDRNDFLAAMNRLHAYYMAPEGLQRPGGLSVDGSPDFVGIATWIFDVYLTCRSAGRSPDDAFGEVVAQITQSDEWKSKHPGEPSLTPAGCGAPPLDRNEFLQALLQLDAFYTADEGLQRPDGLSIGGNPDFVGIAAWIFDIYLNARLAGRSHQMAWNEVIAGIQATDEWKQKHAGAAPSVRFAVIGDYGLAGDHAREVSDLVKGWNVDFIITTGDNNYPNGAASTIDTNIGQYYADFIFPYSGSFTSTATRNRFFPSLGNHDWETPGATPYLAYFTLPGNERYYDFVQTPVHFFAIDSDFNEPDGISASSVQAQWLQGKLSASTSSYRFVYMHHAPFSSAQNGSHATLQWPYKSWGASAVLAGHDHTYERIIRDGLPYFVNGSGGYALYAFGSPVAGSVVRYNADWGALLVEVDGKAATFKFITRGGVVVDTFSVPPHSSQ
ncbi:MAG TPA: metallophosphoesterase [Vicinamibacterales bacterium]|nr:metallophosphoesterase [Vicinamibacterales bacterium]